MRGRNIVVLSTAVRSADLAMWQVILALCPSVRRLEIRSIEVLRPGGHWVSGVRRAVEPLAGERPPAQGAPAAWLVVVAGPKAELRHALDEAAASHLAVPVVAYHAA